MALLAEIPVEIILEIFAFAACTSRSTALALSCVSSWVRRNTAQHLYATVILRSASQVNAFLALIQPDTMYACSTRATNPALYVRNLCITHHAPPKGGCADPFAIIFSACPNVRRAALQSTFLHSSLVPDHPVHQMRCQELTVLGPTFPSDWEKHAHVVKQMDQLHAHAHSESTSEVDEAGATSVLRHTTHLRLLESLSSPQFSGPHLTVLPNLTHLALLIREQPYSTNPFTELDPLLAAPQLLMVVVSFDFRTWIDKGRQLDDWAALAKRIDERLFVVERDYGEPLGQWAVAVRGGQDIWSRAIREQGERETSLRYPSD